MFRARAFAAAAVISGQETSASSAHNNTTHRKIAALATRRISLQVFIQAAPAFSAAKRIATTVPRSFRATRQVAASATASTSTTARSARAAQQE